MKRMNNIISSKTYRRIIPHNVTFAKDNINIVMNTINITKADIGAILKSFLLVILFFIF